ncbi:DUF5050 domain-containing protein [Paenibacillus thiaminolyticus]|uniref:DUF5050 domain-containing protein n=1 Tax=Paenibacillus thiaminolyticus TaxID=49283 RepID=UPI002543FA61|nr:DUF5050 domain-containing protein [Paenibacillus thiaminolyticus]WII38978.1 DUF5050 domain-containing protein [Paenibacillus thiaminolyticus]
MSLLIYEMKKMFVHQKGLLFIGLFFVFSMASLIVFDTPFNQDIEMNSGPYSYYLDQVNGPYSEDTERFFANESKTISDANIALRKAYDNWYEGKISEQEFEALSGPLEKIVQNERGFKLIYDQFAYIREHPDNRYFLYTNGWNGLLANDSLDFLFLALLLVLVTPIFCYEFDSKMDPIILTVHKGTKTQAICKVGLVSMTVIILCLLMSGLRYWFFDLKYGLENGSYPLQSLSYFGTSTKNISLFGTFLTVTACKIFGNLCFAMLIMCVAVSIKKYALTLFTCTALSLLPYYGFKLESSKYFVPGPLGFMVATGYFRGNEYHHNIFTDQMDVVFREVSGPVWLILFAVTLCLSIGMSIVILVRHMNVWGARQRRHWARPLGLSLILCFAVSGLAGCVPKENAAHEDIYNWSSRRAFENERYRFHVDDTDLNDSRIVFEDKKTGKKRNLIRNPLQSLTKVEDSIYGNGPLVYYMKYDYDKSQFREAVDRLSIIEVDTSTFNERIVFEKNVNTEKSNFLGLVHADESDLRFFNTVSSFFLNDDSIYFIGENEIRKVNAFTGRANVIIRFPVLRSAAFDGRNIYYVNEKSEVAKYDTKTDTATVLPDIITDYFVLTDTELLFLNRKDQQKIYAMSLSDSAIRKITDKTALDFRCDDQYIFYVNKADLKKYRIDRDGRNDSLFLE